MQTQNDHGHVVRFVDVMRFLNCVCGVQGDFMAVVADKVVMLFKFSQGSEPRPHPFLAFIGLDSGRAGAEDAAPSRASSAATEDGVPSHHADLSQVAAGTLLAWGAQCGQSTESTPVAAYLAAACKHTLTAAAWAPDGFHLCVGSDTGHITVWDVKELLLGSKGAARVAGPRKVLDIQSDAGAIEHLATCEAPSVSPQPRSPACIVAVAGQGGGLLLWRLSFKSGSGVHVPLGDALASLGARELGDKFAPKQKRGPRAGKPTAGRWWYRRVFFVPPTASSTTCDLVALESSQYGCSVLTRWSIIGGEVQPTEALSSATSSLLLWRIAATEPLTAMDYRYVLVMVVRVFVCLFVCLIVCS